VKKALIKS